MPIKKQKTKVAPKKGSKSKKKVRMEPPPPPPPKPQDPEEDEDTSDVESDDPDAAPCFSTPAWRNRNAVYVNMNVSTVQYKAVYVVLCVMCTVRTCTLALATWFIDGQSLERISHDFQIK